MSKTPNYIKYYDNLDSIVFFKSNHPTYHAVLSNFYSKDGKSLSPKVNKKINEYSIDILGKEGDFIIDGKTYFSVEHYYQTMRQPSDEFKHMLYQCKTSLDCKRMNTKLYKEYKINGIIDTSELDKIMYTALYAKFNQNEKLKEILSKTGNKLLVEVPGRSVNRYQGGAKGENVLGLLLMKVRYILNKNNENPI